MKVAELTCPLCGAAAENVSGLELYKPRAEGASYASKRFYRCSKGCDCYVGAHETGEPFGTMAGKVLRGIRVLAHAAFDGWWRRKGITRRDAYRTLAAELGVQEAHIGQSDEATCRRIVDLFQNRDRR